MNKNFKEVTEDPLYSSEAGSFSKVAVFVFIGIFIYEAFFTSASPGLVWGGVFLFAGMFVASIFIAAPLFFIRKKYSLGLLTDILLIGLIIYFTHVVFQWLF